MLLPLLARLTLRDLLAVIANCVAREPSQRAASETLVGTVVDLPEPHLIDLVTQPEVTSWIRLAREGDVPLERLLPFLGVHVVAAAGRAGATLTDARVAVTGSGFLQFRSLGIGVPLDASTRLVTASAGHGAVHIDGSEGRQIVVWDSGVPSADAWCQPTILGRIVVAGMPDAWLTLTFPRGAEVVSGPPSTMAQYAATFERGARLLDDVWPEAWADVATLLEWAIPLEVKDSYFVPGFRGVIALGEMSPVSAARMLLHEASHNKLSSLLELVDFTTNPNDLAFHPFSREKGPVTSLLQSCWSFTHEFGLVRRLQGHPEAAKPGLDRLERKIRKFLDQALPSMRESARLTPTGSAVMDELERTYETYGDL